MSVGMDVFRKGEQDKSLLYKNDGMIRPVLYRVPNSVLASR